MDKNLTVGGLFGYSSENSITSLKVPSSKGVPSGLKTKRSLIKISFLLFFLCLQGGKDNLGTRRTALTLLLRAA